VGDAKDLEIGIKLARIFHLAHRLGTPVMVHVFTDGSINSSPGNRNWQGDDNGSAAQIFIQYDPALAPGALRSSMVRNQIGHFTEAQASSDDYAFATNVALASQIPLINWLAKQNRLGELAAIVGRDALSNPDSYRFWG